MSGSFHLKSFALLDKHLCLLIILTKNDTEESTRRLIVSHIWKGELPGEAPPL